MTKGNTDLLWNCKTLNSKWRLQILTTIAAF